MRRRVQAFHVLLREPLFKWCAQKGFSPCSAYVDSAPNHAWDCILLIQSGFLCIHTVWNLWSCVTVSMDVWASTSILQALQIASCTQQCCLQVHDVAQPCMVAADCSGHPASLPR